jgi:hypothetical protein
VLIGFPKPIFRGCMHCSVIASLLSLRLVALRLVGPGFALLFAGSEQV